MAETGVDCGAEVAKILGLSVDNLKEFTVTFKPNDLVIVEAAYFTEDIVGKFKDVEKQFKLQEIT